MNNIEGRSFLYSVPENEKPDPFKNKSEGATEEIKAVEKCLQDKPLELEDVESFGKLKRKNEWASEGDVRAYIKEITEKVPSKFKDFKDYQIKSLESLANWEKIKGFFDRMGFEGLGKIQIIILDDDDFWTTFLGNYTSKAILQPKSMFVVRSIYDLERLIDETDVEEEKYINEKLSWIVNATGKLIFHDMLGKESDEYQKRYKKKDLIADTSMDSVAYQLQIKYLKDTGKTEEEVVKFLIAGMDEIYGKDDDLTDEQIKNKRLETEQILKYVENVYESSAEQNEQELERRAA